jgi:hypothetical protein
VVSLLFLIIVLYAPLIIKISFSVVRFETGKVKEGAPRLFVVLLGVYCVLPSPPYW